MSASISMILHGKKCLVSYNGNESSLAEIFTGAALEDEVIAEAITRAAVEVELKRQADNELIQMTRQ